jgi:calcineurin-like phosphoesterase family protein
MTQREKEDKLVETLKDPNEDNHPVKIIDKAIKDKHKVYLATDWHLWRRKVKGKSECTKRSDFDKLIKNINNTLGENDVLIYLGDLVDGEFTDKEALKDVLKTMSGKKIIVLGNNDLFSKSFYKSCGFDYVVQSFVWHNVLFTHMPVKNDNDINVHGHIHGYRTYWIPYTNQIDVGAFGGRNELVELTDILKKQKAYSKTIKECPEHFEEGYTCPIRDGVSLFSSICGSYIQPDPFDD